MCNKIPNVMKKRYIPSPYRSNDTHSSVEGYLSLFEKAQTIFEPTVFLNPTIEIIP